MTDWTWLYLSTPFRPSQADWPGGACVGRTLNTQLGVPRSTTATVIKFMTQNWQMINSWYYPTMSWKLPCLWEFCHHCISGGSGGVAFSSNSTSCWILCQPWFVAGDLRNLVRMNVTWLHPCTPMPLVSLVSCWLGYTLQGTNISPQNSILKMIFLFPRWDMLIPWRVYIFSYPHVGAMSRPQVTSTLLRSLVRTSVSLPLDQPEFFCFGFGGGDLVW